MDDTASPSFSKNLQSLLTTYDDLLIIPTGFPQSRPFDHRIPLQPRATPINVLPYRYPHLQKAEIKRLVCDMLKDGILHPSTSPFSSPVMLIKKKDST